MPITIGTVFPRTYNASAAPEKLGFHTDLARPTAPRCTELVEVLPTRMQYFGSICKHTSAGSVTILRQAQQPYFGSLRKHNFNAE